MLPDIFHEPTEDELRNYMNGFPLLEGFDVINDPYVLPISIQEFWDSFYSNHSRFSAQESHAESENFGPYTDWYEPEEEQFENFENMEVLSQRDIEVYWSLPRNPIWSEGVATKHYLLMSQTPTEIAMAIKVGQYGFPYAEDFELFEYWEVRALDERSN